MIGTGIADIASGMIKEKAGDFRQQFQLQTKHASDILLDA